MSIAGVRVVEFGSKLLSIIRRILKWKSFILPIHCVSKNDTDVTHYRFNAHQPISVIFGRGLAERVCY